MGLGFPSLPPLVYSVSFGCFENQARVETQISVGQLRESLQENDGQKSWGEKMRLLLLQARLREQPAPAREMEFQPQNWRLLCGQ